MRWNGPYGNFTYVSYVTSTPGVANGDVISATVNGNLIIGYVNGVEYIRGNGFNVPFGHPGFGFWNISPSHNADFGTRISQRHQQRPLHLLLPRHQLQRRFIHRLRRRYRLLFRLRYYSYRYCHGYIDIRHRLLFLLQLLLQ